MLGTPRTPGTLGTPRTPGCMLRAMASLTPEGLELGAVRDVPFATSVTMARGERPDVIPLTAAFRERYALSRVLGHGGMGMVVLASTVAVHSR